MSREYHLSSTLESRRCPFTVANLIACTIRIHYLAYQSLGDILGLFRDSYIGTPPENRTRHTNRVKVSVSPDIRGAYFLFEFYATKCGILSFTSQQR